MVLYEVARRVPMLLARLLLLRGVAALLLLISTVPGIASPLAAPAWPSRPVTMVVPYAPGGSTDLVAPLIAPGLWAALGPPVPLPHIPRPRPPPPPFPAA